MSIRDFARFEFRTDILYYISPETMTRHRKRIPHHWPFVRRIVVFAHKKASNAGLRCFICGQLEFDEPPICRLVHGCRWFEMLGYSRGNIKSHNHDVYPHNHTTSHNRKSILVSVVCKLCKYPSKRNVAPSSYTKFKLSIFFSEYRPSMMYRLDIIYLFMDLPMTCGLPIQLRDSCRFHLWPISLA